MRVLTWLLDLLYPPRCTFCGKLLERNETDLCGKCRAALPVVEGAIKRGRFFERCWSLYIYQDDVASSIRRFKFHGMRQYADVYARQLAMLLLRENVQFDILTWVPVDQKRKRQRGFDQSELIARAVAGELKKPCVPMLKKIRHVEAQSRQPSAELRRANVRGAYLAVAPENFADKRVLLIDDVITTGATLTECSAVLRSAGAACVECATVAATMLKTEQ